MTGYLTGEPAPPPVGRGAACVRPAERLLCEARGVCPDYGDAPQTLYGLADSPDRPRRVHHRPRRRHRPARAHRSGPEGGPDGDLTRDDILDNLTLYWLTNTGVSAARLYWENKAAFFDAKDITIPFAISVFPDELYQAPKSWAERAYPNNLIYYNRLDRGGHFAAWEQPQLFSEEMRAASGHFARGSARSDWHRDAGREQGRGVLGGGHRESKGRWQ